MMIWKRIVFRGHVQGVGFRAHVTKLAKLHAIHGNVENQKDGTVIVRAVGTPENFSEFTSKVGANPGKARIDMMHAEDDMPWQIIPGFHIRIEEDIMQQDIEE